MTDPLARVLEQALALPKHDRLTLAATLWASVEEDPVPDEVQAAWLEELRRRVERIESGEDPGVPWEEVRERLAVRFGSRGGE